MIPSRLLCVASSVLRFAGLEVLGVIGVVTGTRIARGSYLQGHVSDAPESASAYEQ